MGTVDLAIIDVPWGRLPELTRTERDELRLACDYMMKEGSTIVLLCSWQLLHVFQQLFEERKAVVQHRDGNLRGPDGPPTHSTRLLKP